MDKPITLTPEQPAQRPATPVPRLEDASILILGASGDLTARKLIPALFALRTNGFLSERSPVIGLARRDKTDDEFRREMHEALTEGGRRAVAAEAWQAFARQLFYRRADLSDAGQYREIDSAVSAIERESGVSGRRVVYLATAPELFLPAVQGLAAAGMIPDAEATGRWLRVVIEKPFGHDLDSARRLSRELGRLLSEDQIYRIDHYLGKETVQNILLFRFGNAIFEPLLDRRYVDHVQITVAESQGIERGRGAYYDRAGALRDVLQNHGLQLLALTAMEPPAYFLAKHIRDEKLKVLEALAPGRPGSVSEWAVAGQYTAGEIGGEPAAGYRQEDRVAPDSRRETYVALEVRVDNWRWAGVPFYLRTGKRLPHRVTEVAIQFKLPPLHLFTTVECEGDICDLVGARPNTLIFRIQPREAISLMFSTKRPGMQYQIHPVTMDFAYEAAFEQGLPEAYERLLLDVLRGDTTLFTRNDELEAAWRFVQPALDAWERPEHQPEPYRAGTWGPATADRLLERTGRHWRRPSAGRGR